MTELDFVADEWTNVTGRGWLALFKEADQLPEKMYPTDLVSRYVKIDGKEYWVRAVEYAGFRRAPFGLLIRGQR